MSMLSEIRCHPKRFYNTLGLFWVFISHGLVLGIMGPSMLDLAIACNTDVAKITYIMTGRAGGYALGSFVTAFIYSRLDVPISIAVGTFISAGIIFAIPFVRNVYVLIAIFFTLGSNMGVFEAAINVFVIDLWGKGKVNFKIIPFFVLSCQINCLFFPLGSFINCHFTSILTENPPFMQLLHFCYGVGALISPLFTKPFLLETEEDEEDGDKLLFNEHFNSSDLENTFQFNSSSSHSPHTFTADDLLIKYPYGIIALCMIVSSTVFTLIRVYFRVNTHIDPHPSRKSEQLCHHNQSSSTANKIDKHSLEFDQVQLKSPKLPPHVARIMKSQISAQQSTCSSPSSKCTKCQRVRRFTFTNHGNSLSIVSNSSGTNKLPSSAKVFNLTGSTQVGEVAVRRTDDFHSISLAKNCLTCNNSKVNSPFTSPLASPIGSPFATPLFKPKFDHLRTQSVTSGCSQCRPAKHESQRTQSVTGGPSSNTEITPTSSPIEKYKILVVVLCGFFMHFYCATEMTFGSFVAPFAVKSDLHMSKRSAAVVSSVFWASFTFYRLIMVFLVEFLGSRNSVLIDVFLCLLSNVFLVPFGDKYEWCLWTGAALMGIGLSAIWASIIGYIEEFMPVTSRIMAVFMITACLGQVLLPAIISPFMETYPKALMWVSLTYSIAMVVFFIAITLVCGYKLTKDPRNAQKTTESHST